MSIWNSSDDSFFKIGAGKSTIFIIIIILHCFNIAFCPVLIGPRGVCYRIRLETFRSKSETFDWCGVCALIREHCGAVWDANTDLGTDERFMNALWLAEAES